MSKEALNEIGQCRKQNRLQLLKRRNIQDDKYGRNVQNNPGPCSPTEMSVFLFFLDISTNLLE